jgi:hypothetical protein
MFIANDRGRVNFYLWMHVIGTLYLGFGVKDDNLKDLFCGCSGRIFFDEASK